MSEARAMGLRRGAAFRAEVAAGRFDGGEEPAAEFVSRALAGHRVAAACADDDKRWERGYSEGFIAGYEGGGR